MELNERINALSRWGEAIRNINEESKAALLEKAKNKNRWFTEENCSYSLNEIIKWLEKDALENWIKSYTPTPNNSKMVGIVMAGNIPLVGFHDLLCVLISGHLAKVKLSSQDDVLIPFLVNILVKEDSRWHQRISFVDRLNAIDAVIATGSDNSARYFEHYFKAVPSIIRKNRTSVAVIMGDETPGEFKLLAHDIFSYFGLGCRNVSKLYLPLNFDLNNFFEPFSLFKTLVDHGKYGNNYDYQKSIRLISSKPFHDFGFLVMEESTQLVSPIAVSYFEYYKTQDQLKELLESNAHKIQCITSAKGWFSGSVPFGKAQQPELNDYADNIDTLRFLLAI